MINIDDAKSRFETYCQNLDTLISQDLNESDTRSKLIDNLLINVLGWNEEDIKREGSIDSGKYDYVLSAPNIKLVIEAKKEAFNPNLPSKQNKIKIKTLYQSNKNIIDQIRNYAIELGIQYGLITNGKQFILAKLLNIDRTNWKQNECLVFDGLSEISERFVEFYDNLSKYAIVNNGGFKFEYQSKIIESTTLLSRIVDRDKEIVRNNLSADLTPKIDQIYNYLEIIIFIRKMDSSTSDLDKTFRYLNLGMVAIYLLFILSFFTRYSDIDLLRNTKIYTLGAALALSLSMILF